MAFDLKLMRFCDHIQVEDRFLEPDGRTIKLLAPMSNSFLTRLFRNDTEVKKDIQITVNGRVVINPYAWTVTVDPGSSSDYYNQPVPKSLIETRKSIYLNNVSEVKDDLWRVQYQTMPEYCRKCHNISVIDDMAFSVGRLSVVRDAEKLGQDLRKMVITKKTSNRFHQWYGTYFVDYIGRGFAGSLSLSQLYSELNDGIANLIRLQEQQMAFQFLTKGERVKRLLNMNISRLEGDPTFVEVVVNLETEAGEKIEISTLVNIKKGPLYFSDTNFNRL